MIDPHAIDERSPRVTRRTLREFAGLCVIVFGGLFALNLYRHGGRPTTGGWVAGALVVLVGLPGLIQPALIRPVYLGATALTRPIGHIIGLVLLGMIYYGLITPLALVFRLMGRDQLALRRRAASSYWEPRAQPNDPRLYLRQFQLSSIRPVDIESPRRSAQEPEATGSAGHEPLPAPPRRTP